MLSTFVYTICFVLLVTICFSIVFLAKTNRIDKEYSYTALFIVSSLSFLLVFINGFTLKQIGITSPSNSDIIIYSLLTIFCCLIIYVLNKGWFKLKRNLKTREDEIRKFIFYTTISVTVQEFLFRTFLYYSLIQMNIFNIYTMVIFSCLLFGIAHLAFKGTIFKTGVFIMGIIWGISYFYIPNLILIAISHAIIGMFAYYQGIIDETTFFLEPLKLK